LVFADRNKVKRVFLNLVNNAIQAFPCGEKVSVRTFAEKGAAVFPQETSHGKRMGLRSIKGDPGQDADFNGPGGGD
jgi:nitrogen-specific signal transduction histidine kinase